MNVPNISQGPGSVTALPRAVSDGDPVAAGHTDSAVRGHSPDTSPRPNISFTRLAWFDVNGDGHIDPRSAAAGGDATLLVPAHAVDLPTYSRRVHPVGGAPSAKSAADDRAVTLANTAQTNRAVDAYQRYGQTPPEAAAPAGVGPPAAAALTPPAPPAAPAALATPALAFA